MTQNAVSVTHSASRSGRGSFEKTERRQYFPKTPETLAAVNAALAEAGRSGKVKKLRVDMKK